MNSMKSQNDMTLKDETHRSVEFQMLLEKSGEVSPERMKRMNQSRNDAQVWLYLMVKVKSDAVKNNIE